MSAAAVIIPVPEPKMPDEPIYEIASLGEGLKLRSRKTTEFTKAVANTFLEMPEFVGERNMDNNHAVFLARQMESGTFRWEQVNVASCFCDGREYRMNGQHTAWGRIEADLPEGTRTPVQWLRYEAESDHDMRQLYATFDRGKPRSMGNVVVSYLSGRIEFDGYSKALLKMLAEGLAFWLWDEPDVRALHTGDERSYLLLADHYKTAMAVGGLMRSYPSPKESKHMRRAPVTAALFATLAKAPLVGAAFWKTVLEGVGITNKEDPQHVLRNYLMTTSLSKGPANSDMKSVTQEEMYRACLHSWNLHRGGKTIKSIKPASLEKRPEAK